MLPTKPESKLLRFAASFAAANLASAISTKLNLIFRIIPYFCSIQSVRRVGYRARTPQTHGHKTHNKEKRELLLDAYSC
jgi:hypothetical protein